MDSNNVASELQRERAYVLGLYSRLDELRDEARIALDAVRANDVGGNHQSRSERDAFARLYEDRLAQLDSLGDRLVFGRIELATSPATENPFRYIGRIGLRDASLTPILLDWRVPQAAAFYQATARNPLGARARRHLITNGRALTRIDDEVFDGELLADDSVPVQGEAALLAAVSAERTGKMTDIVATIQAEQDAIIRSGLAGILVVQGGPGTGKTAVALHRAAYLLYTYRDRLKSSGVLVVGPSRAFTHYIEGVLPSLGESGVVVSSLGGLYPGLETELLDDPAVARVKGQLRMAELVRAAVRDRQRVPAESVDVRINGEKLAITPDLIRRAMQRAWDSRKPHNEARVVFVRAALAELGRELARVLRAGGSTVDDADEAVLREDLRTSEQIKIALNTAWMPLTPQKLIADLYARPNWLRTLTASWSDKDRALLSRERTAGFTVSDVPLLDEAELLLGSDDSESKARAKLAKKQAKRDRENAEAAISNFELDGMVNARDVVASFTERDEYRSTAERAAEDREWSFGHIVVDEAQELTPMQWRLLGRKAPLRSFTIVGDIAQGSTLGVARSWEDALAPLIRKNRSTDEYRVEQLTVNYRTPRQIAQFAEARAQLDRLPVTTSVSVRETEWPVTTYLVDPDNRDPEALVDEVTTAIEDELDRQAENAGGSIAVIISEHRISALGPILLERFGEDIARGSAGLDKRIAIVTPADAKGLEFDCVIVVDAQGIRSESERGASSLYVSLTRATQRLVLVGFNSLPVE